MRPGMVSVVAAFLCVLAVICVIGGLAASEVSACCGSPDPPDRTYALVGVLAGGALVLAALCLWAGSMPWWGLLLCAAVLPIICAAAAPSSLDLAGLLPFALAGWAAFWWFLRRPRVAAWLRS